MLCPRVQCPSRSHGTGGQRVENPESFSWVFDPPHRYLLITYQLGHRALDDGHRLGSRETFRPSGLRRPSIRTGRWPLPDTSCAFGALMNRCEAPHLQERWPPGAHPAGIRALRSTAPSIPLRSMTSFACPLGPNSGTLVLHTALSLAPAGISPYSRYRHRAINNFLATATIPTLRARCPPPEKRAANHRLNALSG